MIRHQSFYFLILISIYTFYSDKVSAGNTLLEPLNFGTIVVINNDSVGKITIALDGKITLEGPISIITPGHPAQFRFSNLPSYTQLNVTANVLSATTTIAAGTSEQFTLSNMVTLPSVTTNALGTVLVLVGGTLETSGVGVGDGGYLDTTYSATYEVTVDF
jgi:hypothetical protein